MPRLFEKASLITTINEDQRIAVGDPGSESQNIEWTDFKALFYEDWITLNGAVKYRKVLFNWVEVSINGQQFDDEEVLGTLPVGYRPLASNQLPIASPNLDPVSVPPVDDSAYVQIDNDGTMTLRVSTLGSISATNSTFRFPLD